MCNYGILLSQIEDTIDSNNFREYAFGFPDMNSVSLFDESFIRTIAIKKMLHFLSTISLNNKNSSSFEKEYSSRVKILIIKLEKKLLLELNSDDLKDHESNMFEDHLSVEFENKYRTLNSKNSEDDITIKNLDEVVNNPTDNISNDIKLTKEINEELKEDLTVLAEEMKNSALRFGELMKREKEILSELDSVHPQNIEKTFKSTQEMKKYTKSLRMSLLKTVIMAIISIILFISLIVFISIT